MGMSGKEFVRKLKKLNSRIRVFPGSGRVDGIYLYMPKHPVSNPETGLKHLGSMPSSRLFSSLPKFSFWDDNMGGFNRGWQGVLRMLTEFRFAGRPVIHRSEALRMFGSFPTSAKLPMREKPVWWAQKRAREKFQIKNLASNGQQAGQVAVNV